LSDDLSRDIHLIKQGKQQQQRWKDMMAIGLPNSASEAESRTLEAINQWASDTGVDLLSVKPEYRRSDESLVPVVFRVTANGSMKAIAKFIWKVETADIPVCVDTLQINARDKKNKDELSMQMGVSALYRKSDSKEVTR
ncbi:MAG: type 4a pilus biogenesis protein PilO, partial [Phycisphaeraceae bacterium JB051]